MIPESFVLFLVFSFLDTAKIAIKAPTCQDVQSELDTPFLWSVRREPPAYFFGTIHVPYTRVWDFIPEGTKQAFEASDNVFFELDLLDPRTISALASCQMLPKGTALVDLLPQDLFHRLKVHLDYVKMMMPSWMSADQRGRGLYAEYLFQAITGNWERKRPVWVMLMVNALTENDVKSRGIPVLDLFLAQEAERLNKKTGAVERVEEQCLPLNGLNLSQALHALNKTLLVQEVIRSSGGTASAAYTAEDLIRHYNCQDHNAEIFVQDITKIPALSDAILSEGNDLTVDSEESSMSKEIDAYFREELVVKRNRRMAERVTKFLEEKKGQSIFFVFGAECGPQLWFHGSSLKLGPMANHTSANAWPKEMTQGKDKASRRIWRLTTRKDNEKFLSGEDSSQEKETAAGEVWKTSRHERDVVRNEGSTSR